MKKNNVLYSIIFSVCSLLYLIDKMLHILQYNTTEHNTIQQETKQQNTIKYNDVYLTDTQLHCIKILILYIQI
jgi:hypothetical protein